MQFKRLKASVKIFLINKNCLLILVGIYTEMEINKLMVL